MVIQNKSLIALWTVICLLAANGLESATRGAALRERRIFEQALKLKLRPTATPSRFAPQTGTSMPQPTRPTSTSARPQDQTSAAAVTNPIGRLLQSKPTAAPEEEESESMFDMLGQASNKLEDFASKANYFNPTYLAAKLINKTMPDEVKMALQVVNGFCPGIKQVCISKIAQLALNPVKMALEAGSESDLFTEGSIPRVLFKGAKHLLDYYEKPNRTRASLGEVVVNRYFKGEEEDGQNSKSNALKAVRAGSVALDLNSLFATTYNVYKMHTNHNGRGEIPYCQALSEPLIEFAEAYQDFMIKYESDNAVLKLGQHAAEKILPYLKMSSEKVIPYLPMTKGALVDKVLGIIKGMNDAGGPAEFMNGQMAKQMAQFGAMG